jgi:hypothetical protein
MHKVKRANIFCLDRKIELLDAMKIKSRERAGDRFLIGFQEPGLVHENPKLYYGETISFRWLAHDSPSYSHKDYPWRSG